MKNKIFYLSPEKFNIYQELLKEDYIVLHGKKEDAKFYKLAKEFKYIPITFKQMLKEMEKDGVVKIERKNHSMYFSAIKEISVTRKIIMPLL